MIRRYVSGLLSSNMYLIIEEDHAIIVDPYEDTSPAEGYIIDYIFLTHEHYDHISGVNIWQEKTHAPVLCSKACAVNIQNPRKNLAYYFKDFCEIQTWMVLDKIPPANMAYTCAADVYFENEMNLEWHGHDFHLFELPGHSQGSIGILMDGKFFFSGDSLMEHNEIEFRMPGGSRKKWEEISACRLAAIPNSIIVFPGHFKEFIYKKKGAN